MVVKEEVESSRKRQKKSSAPSALPKMAYLGPEGTYGHQAAMIFHERLKKDIELEACPTISSIYNNPAIWLVMPLENTIHGVVTDTLDCLLSPLDPIASSSGTSKQPLQGWRMSETEVVRPLIVGETNLHIKHCLVAKKGVKMEDIRWVRSHEQALGQSSAFISKYLPNAKIQNWPSTAGAAVSLLSPTEADTKLGKGAAICSKAIMHQYSDQLEILWEGTQSLEDNYTRFILLYRDYFEDYKWASPVQLSDPKTSILSSSDGFTEFRALRNLNALKAILGYGPIIKIHARPVPSENSLPRRDKDIKQENGTTESQEIDMFPTWYFVECQPDYIECVGRGEEDERENEVQELGSIYLGASRLYAKEVDEVVKVDDVK